MSRMNKAWKIVQPKAKPRTYSRITSVNPVRPTTLEIPRKSADAVAGNTVHRRSQGLPPAHGDVTFMQPRQGLAAAEDV